MKKLIITIGLLGTIFSCSDDYYESLNQDPTLPTDVPANFLVTAATVSLFDQMVTPNVNLNASRFLAQYWTETTYIDEANFDLNGRNITGRHWTEMYGDVLFDLEDAKNKVESYPLTSTYSQQTKDNQLAIIDLLQVYAWHQLVDTFGNIPYSEAFQGLENPIPAFDDAATIYDDLLSRVSADISMLNLSGNGFDNDPIYNGNISAWRKFAGSLKLKIGMQLADVNPAKAQAAATEAITTGVFTSNADNFSLAYQSTTPNVNPLYDDLVLSGRSDFVGANTIIDIMNAKNDPRRPVYFKENMGSGVFIGGVYGGEENTFGNSSQIGALFHESTLPGTLLEYSEVEFLLAEAVERGFGVGGSAESHYNAAILASMEFWGVDAGMADNYLSSPGVAYGTAPGTWQQKIAVQFWIAMYNRGFEGWTVWRKFDYPELNLPAFSENPIPTRYTYPVSEQTINPDNYDQAAEAIGGDEQTTKLFWDVH